MSTDNFTAIGFANDTIKQKNIKQWKYVSTGSKTKKHKKILYNMVKRQFKLGGLL